MDYLVMVAILNARHNLQARKAMVKKFTKLSGMFSLVAYLMKEMTRLVWR